MRTCRCSIRLRSCTCKTCNMQHATCEHAGARSACAPVHAKHATCNMRTCEHANMQVLDPLALLYMQNMQHATCEHANMRTCRCSIRLRSCTCKTCNMQHATCEHANM